ncbi:MAG: rhodanese-like domain-containing protein [Chitinophagales bacterium]
MIKNTLTILLLSALFSFQYACSQADTSKSNNTAAETTQSLAIAVDLDTEAFYQQVTTHPGQIVDVRTPEEFAAGHITHAVNIDLRDPGFKSKLTQLDKNQPVYLYCGSGNRSTQAKNILAEEGFTAVYNHKGYFKTWVSSGYPVTQ